ncbi:MAG TPA: YxeA family protein [Pseudogracilibacillus sp.]|nr:YxeA family protein [Pseudogracilibacillus sp.]
MSEKNFVLSMGTVIPLLAVCSPQPFQKIGSAKYFVEIDDESEKQENEKADDTRYEYHLMGFDKNGDEENFPFSAGKKLKQGAFLQVYYRKDEVISYEEMDEEDVPEQAMEFFDEKNNS